MISHPPLISLRFCRYLGHKNVQVDLLSKLVAVPQSLKENLLGVLDKLSIEEDPSLVLQVDFEPSWMDLLVDYQQEEKHHKDRNKACKIKNQAMHYVLLEGKLYKRLFSLPLFR